MAERELDVYYHGRRVGTLAETYDKLVAFQYSDEWLADGFSISPFHLPLKDSVFIPKPVDSSFFYGMFGVFADSLPDSWGMLLLERSLAKQGIDIRNINSLDRLAYVGDSGMGALEYYPARNNSFSANGIDYDLIAGECAKLLSSKPSEHIDMLFGMGGSSGGTRPKILISEAGREWIIKFPANSDSPDSGLIEYEYSLLAGKCGINMTQTMLVSSKRCPGYFKTERFDRKVYNGEVKKIFAITFAGLLEADFRIPSCDYSTYMKLIMILTHEDRSQIEQMFRIMCFNVFMQNLDDHTKNFSFIYDDVTGWKLAPAYDMTKSETYFGEHTTSVNGKGRDISDDDLISVGKTAGMSYNRCKQIIEEIKQTIGTKEA